MPQLRLNNVRWMSLKEIAQLWGPELGLPAGLIVHELQLAVINFQRWEEGKVQLEELPPDHDLPDPDERVDKPWLEKFCEKQGWDQPEFWFRRYEQAQRFPGRPGYTHRPALERELRRRGETGELNDKLAAEVRYLREWAVQMFPDDQPPSLRTLENVFRHLYRDLNRPAQRD